MIIVCLALFINHEITQIFTRNFLLERKALPEGVFSFSTGFLFVKKKKC